MDDHIMNISFFTSGHEPYDDRIFFHMARFLSDNGQNVEVISSKIDLKKSVDGTSLNCFAGDILLKRKKSAISGNVCQILNRIY